MTVRKGYFIGSINADLVDAMDEDIDLAVVDAVPTIIGTVMGPDHDVIGSVCDGTANAVGYPLFIALANAMRNNP